MMVTRRNEDPYFLWLCSLVRIGGRARQKVEFAWALHQKEFYCLIPNDDNRCEDGRHLREIFSDQANEGNAVDLAKPCTVLEMLIGVALRMEHVLSNNKRGDRTVKWFWELVKNLELDDFEDDDPNIEEKILHNDLIVSRMLSRHYTRNGQGGLFPLRKTDIDQRRLEIWYQMMEYLDENYINN